MLDHTHPYSRLCLCLFLLIAAACVAPTAWAKTFYPSNVDELNAAIAEASRNEQSDVVDLSGETILLNQELVLHPDDGYGLTLKNGVLERRQKAKPFRLLHVVALPYFVEGRDEGVLLEELQFRNGLHSELDVVANVSGGGALLTHRPTRIVKSHFVNNRMFGNGSGGAILHTADLEVDSTLFANNAAIANGEYERTKGGAISTKPGASIYIAHTYFLGNSADEGGALYAAHNVRYVNITRSAFDGNSASRLGGAVWSNVGDGELRVSNTSFVANEAPDGGGAMYTQSLFASVSFNHLTLWGNQSRAGNGGGLKALLPRDGSNVTLRNSIVTNNVGGNCRSTEGGDIQFALSEHNLIDDDSCGQQGMTLVTGIGSVFSGRFEHYGGLIPSLPIPAASPAANLVPRESCLAYDARDVPRLDNGDSTDYFCDAGAFEFVPIEDIDVDGDLVRNVRDNCLAVSNPLQSDIDADGVGDACDTRDDRDSDDDTVLNFIDNCPTVKNLLQIDTNNNDIGDACEDADISRVVAPMQAVFR